VCWLVVVAEAHRVLDQLLTWLRREGGDKHVRSVSVMSEVEEGEYALQVQFLVDELRVADVTVKEKK
jgi:hypothetical protein